MLIRPSRFNPMSIANKATKVGIKTGTCPYMLPKKPLRQPNKTKASTMPLQKEMLLLKGIC